MATVGRVSIAGGDGFIGWPLALALSDAGCNVCIADNLLRRDLVRAVNGNSLRPLSPPHERIDTWRTLRSDCLPISFEQIDIAEESTRLTALFRSFRPETVIHLATIPSAPYSMKDAAAGRPTILNNALCTWAILNAAVESGLDFPIVHIGTMGVYGYDVEDYDLPEGYLHVEIPTRNGRRRPADILHPTKPGSLYHLTK